MMYYFNYRKICIILRYLHSTCFLGQQIERVARKQIILNIDQLINSSELLVKHVIPCAEYIKIVGQSSVNFMLILDIARYNVKCLNIFNSSLNIMKPDICLLYKIRELSLNYVSDGIDEVIKRVSCCKSLSKLDMSFNKIEEFSKLYDILLNTKLQILNLSFNNIEYLKYVNEDTWRILSQSILEVL
ncbi:hypothetical protein GJ496_006296 [Pomphorhynchus laevis]|nr:hypothetical protein GJ496_006296 [Pomphorhynchus laevis]